MVVGDRCRWPRLIIAGCAGSAPIKSGKCCAVLDATAEICNNNYTMPTSKSQVPISGALQKAIVDSKLPFLTLEQKTGVKRQSLMKFMAGETSLRLDIADRLAAYFGLELTKRKRR